MISSFVSFYYLFLSQELRAERMEESRRGWKSKGGDGRVEMEGHRISPSLIGMQREQQHLHFFVRAGRFTALSGALYLFSKKVVKSQNIPENLEVSTIFRAFYDFLQLFLEETETAPESAANLPAHLFLWFQDSCIQFLLFLWFHPCYLCFLPALPSHVLSFSVLFCHLVFLFSL